MDKKILTISALEILNIKEAIIKRTPLKLMIKTIFFKIRSQPNCFKPLILKWTL